ncbi:MAG: hypothetical protein HY883_07670, partial [Deltaproteobacteria bacterium]|nr:hypothetical protein [Deltaproteobacteria bacterium]
LTKKCKDNILIDLKELFEDPLAILKYLENDLEAPVTARYPCIKGLKGLLKERGASGALMSGSGPTVFGIFSERIDAERVCADIRQRLGPPHRIFLVRGL